MNKDEEIQIARKALSALTRLRQGYNPFKDGQLDKMESDEKMYCECCKQLNVAESYDNFMLTFLQDIIRNRNSK